MTQKEFKIASGAICGEGESYLITFERENFTKNHKGPFVL